MTADIVSEVWAQAEVSCFWRMRTDDKTTENSDFFWKTENSAQVIVACHTDRNEVYEQVCVHSGAETMITYIYDYIYDYLYIWWAIIFTHVLIVFIRTGLGPRQRIDKIN